MFKGGALHVRCILVVYTVKPLFSGHMIRLWPFFRYSRFRPVMQHLCNCNIRSETDDYNVCIPNPTREHEPLVTSKPMRDELMQRCVEATLQGLSPTAAGLCLHGNKLLHACQGQTATQGSGIIFSYVPQSQADPSPEMRNKLDRFANCCCAKQL